MVAVMASGEVVSLTAGMAIVAGVAEGFKMVSGTATESKVKKQSSLEIINFVYLHLREGTGYNNLLTY